MNSISASHKAFVGVLIFVSVALFCFAQSQRIVLMPDTNRPVSSGVLIVETNKPDHIIKWLGSPITGERFGGGPAMGLRDQIQESDVVIGLRDDGVVVWKKR